MAERVDQLSTDIHFPAAEMNWLERLLSMYSISKSLKLLGIFHTIHGPILVLFPFVYEKYVFDLLYLNYFFIIILSYILLNRECAISFLAKYIENPDYIPGTRLNYFPEMAEICSQPIYFFMTTSVGYCFSVLHVIHRLQVPYELTLIQLSSIIFYLGFPENTRNRGDFLVYQEILKHIMMVSIFFTTTAIFSIS